MKTALVIVFAVTITFAAISAWRVGDAARDMDSERAVLAQETAAVRAEVRRALRHLETAESASAHWRSVLASAHEAKVDPAAAVASEPAKVEESLRSWQAQTKNPYVHIRWVAQQRVRLAGSEPFLRELGLSSAQIERFNQISIDGAEKLRDLRALTDGGLFPDNDPAIAKLKAQTTSGVDTALRELLGDSGYAQLQEYQRMSVAGELVAGFAAAAVIAGVPVAVPELKQLVHIHANASSSYRNGEAVSPASIDWEWVDTLVQPLLSETQWKIFKASNFGTAHNRTYDQVLVAIAKAAQAEAARTQTARPPGS